VEPVAGAVDFSVEPEVSPEEVGEALEALVTDSVPFFRDSEG
jgi:hypothetical protein